MKECPQVGNSAPSGLGLGHGRAERGHQFITLNKASHTYTCNGRILQSVGTVVKRLIPRFDRENLSLMVARKRGTPQAEVLKEWEAKRDTAANKGHLVHARIDHELTGTETDDSKACETSTPSWSTFTAWRNWWLEASKSLTIIGTEHSVGDLDLGIAGTCDLLCASTKTNKKHVFDWKTNGRFDLANHYGENLLAPFNDLPNCHFNVHSLQVSLYSLLLNRQGEDCGDAWIIHVNGVATPHRALDLRARLEEWLSL